MREMSIHKHTIFLHEKPPMREKNHGV